MILRDKFQGEKKKENKEASLAKYIIQIAGREGVSPQEMQQVISDSFFQCFPPEEKEGLLLEFEFSDDLLIFQKYHIVKQIVNKNCDILESDPRLKKGKIKDDIFFLPLNVADFSFVVSQNIRRNIQQRIQGIKQKKQLKLFEGEENFLIKGKLFPSPSFDFYLVNLEGGGIGHWPKEEWKNVYLPHNRSYYFLVKEVQQENSTFPKIILTCNGEEFLKKIMELEVPELKNGVIKIHQIIRFPGVLSKVLLFSSLRSVDPIGTCIGQAASRIRSIRENLFSEEKIELAVWKEEDKKQTLLSLLLPVKVISLWEKDDTWQVVVPAQHYFSTLKNRFFLLKKIAFLLEKKIEILIYEEIEDNKKIYVWNGNITYNEYLNGIRKQSINK